MKISKVQIFNLHNQDEEQNGFKIQTQEQDYPQNHQSDQPNYQETSPKKKLNPTSKSNMKSQKKKSNNNKNEIQSITDGVKKVKIEEDKQQIQMQQEQQHQNNQGLNDFNSQSLPNSILQDENDCYNNNQEYIQAEVQECQTDYTNTENIEIEKNDTHNF